MTAQTFELNHCYNMDCMEAMAAFPNDYFDLAVVDPPYFSGPERRGFYGSKVSRIGVHRDYPVSPAWEVPGKEYFDELTRVSRHYIIWGCNYFSYGFAPGRIVWDKCNQATSFSDCEIAATDLLKTVRLFRYMWSGMMQGKSISEGHIICDMDMTEHSKKFPDVKSYYDHRIWSKATVAKSVKKGWITADEYAEIVGEPYAA